jgi:hypothetical protein
MHDIMTNRASKSAAPPTPADPTGPLNGIDEVPLREPGWIERLLGKKPRDNAFLEIRNLLARTPIRELSPAQVEQVLAGYGLTPEEAEPQFKNLYAMVLRNAVRDFELTDEEMAELSHLRRVFGLSDADVRSIEGEMLEDAYRTQTRLAVGDTRLTDEEKARLQELAARLRIPESLARSIREEEVGKVFDRVFNATIVDRRLSEEEERYLEDLAGNLGVRIQHDQRTLRQLDRFRLLWRIEQGEIPTVASTHPLEAHEHVHFATAAVRHDPVTLRPRQEGRRVRLGKCVYWKLEEPALAAAEGAWTPSGEGTLSITNRRLIFAHDAARDDLRHEDMNRFTVYRDGLQVEMVDGHDRLFKLEGDAEIAGTILGVFVKATRG